MSRIGNIRGGLRVLHAAAFVIVLAGTAGAQTFPSQTVRIVIPFPPGGAVDTTARLIQPALEKALGQPVVIDNRPGAAGLIGTDHVAKSVPDGHTLLFVASTHTVNSAVRVKLPYDPHKDLAPVVQVAKNPLVILVNPGVQAKSLKELVALAKAAPGKLNYGSPGVASQPHMIMELFKLRAGIDMQHVPFKGGAPAAMATIAGDVQATLLAPQTSLANVQAGKLRALATGGLEREPEFPDLPTIAESGYPGFEAIQWFGLFAPGKTPQAVIERLNAEINKVIRDPGLIAKMKAQGVAPAGGSAESFADLVGRETRNWADAAKAAKVRIE